MTTAEGVVWLPTAAFVVSTIATPPPTIDRNFSRFDSRLLAFVGRLLGANNATR